MAGLIAPLRPVRQRRRGQALAEFGLIICIFMAIVVTVLDFMPVFTLRTHVLNTAAVAVERSTRYLAPTGESVATQRSVLCTQILTMARVTIADAGYAVTTGADGCRGAADATHNPAVNVYAVDSAGNPATGNPLTVGTRVRVCVSYQWRPAGGVLWLMLNGPNNVRSQVNNVFTSTFCGIDRIDEHRSR